MGQGGRALALDAAAVLNLLWLLLGGLVLALGWPLAALVRARRRAAPLSPDLVAPAVAPGPLPDVLRRPGDRLVAGVEREFLDQRRRLLRLLDVG
jgi:hypothetical protein